MNVGILTGGGDCPGLNAVIRAVVRKIANAGGTSVGLFEGWRGLVEGKSRPLSVLDTDGIIASLARFAPNLPDATCVMRALCDARDRGVIYITK